MSYRTKLLAALGAFTLVATPLIAAGMWPNLPIVGGAAYCGGFATGTSGQVCTTTVPAGPSALKGSELIPADTRNASGSPPQTVLVPVAALHAQPLSYTELVAPGQGADSYPATPNYGGVVVVGSGTITQAQNFVLPVSPIDGQEYRISANQTLNVITVTASDGATVSNGPTALTASATAPMGYTFHYRASNTTWYRLQ
jgi:hypothetical protein